MSNQEDKFDFSDFEDLGSKIQKQLIRQLQKF